jgi:predicted XRE-type DNA-binding protein
MPKSSNKEKDKKEKPWVESSGNVFKDLGFNDEEAANLFARSTLMLQIKQTIEDNAWTQEEAAKVLRVKQPRVAEIMKLKTQLFSVDLLLKYLTRLGKRVDMTIQEAGHVT